jgi:predicted amidophosphoribosyltransferase
MYQEKDYKMWCPQCNRNRLVWWGVCDVCGYDITHQQKNKS